MPNTTAIPPKYTHTRSMMPSHRLWFSHAEAVCRIHTSSFPHTRLQPLLRPRSPYSPSGIRLFPMVVPLLVGSPSIGHDQWIDSLAAVDAAKAERLARPQQDFLRAVRNQRHHVSMAAGAGPLLLSDCSHLLDSVLHDIQFGSFPSRCGVQTSSFLHLHRNECADATTTG